jgi:hypothetical protein
MVLTRRPNGKEDFFESELINGKWNIAKPLEGNISTSEYDGGAQNISQDGQWITFTGCSFPNGYGSCDIYISHLTKQGWSNQKT